MIAVRPLGPADEPTWRPLWRDYLAFYGTELSADVYAASFARMTDPRVPDYHGLLAVGADGPVGLAHFIYHRHGWRIEDVCYLQDLYVSPQARGAGAGEALVRAVYAAADAAGRSHVYWLTQTDNAAARSLYDRIGTATTFMKYQRRSGT